MQFQYVAYNLKEGVVKGRVEADDEAHARREVEEQGYKPLRLKAAWQPPTIEALFPSFYKIKEGELLGFTRQLSTMVRSGASLQRTMEMLEAETANPVMQRTINAIMGDIDEGASLSSAMGKHPTVFDALYVSIVEVGEYTGRLAPALDELADMMESGREAKQRIVKSMMMPMFQVGMAVLMVGLNVFVLLPPLFESFDEDSIPLMMAVLMDGADWAKAHPFHLFGTAFVLIVANILLGKFPAFNYWKAGAKLKLPLMGPLMISGEMQRFSRTLGMLLTSGVGLADALELAIRGTSNHVIRAAYEDAQESLVTGKGLTEALRRHPVLPKMWVELVNIGEQSNTLGNTMNELANAYLKRLESQINAILTVLEPASTLAVGGIVIFLAMSMLNPIMSQMSEFAE